MLIIHERQCVRKCQDGGMIIARACNSYISLFNFFLPLVFVSTADERRAHPSCAVGIIIKKEKIFEEKRDGEDR